MSGRTKCHQRRESIAALVLGELDEARAGELREHMLACPFCRAAYDALADEEKTVRSTFDLIAQKAEAIEQSLASRAPARPALPARKPAPLQQRLIEGVRRMKTVYRIAAAVVIAAVVVAGLALLPQGQTGPAIAVADVLREIATVRTITHTTMSHVGDLPPGEFRTMVLLPARVRSERVTGEEWLRTVCIQDLRTGESLHLWPDKTATVSYFPSLGRPDTDYLDSFRRRAELADEYLGTCEIEGRTAVGFRHNKSDSECWTLWADVETHLPLRVECDWIDSKTGHLHRVVTSDYEFNVSLDESLFSLDVPEGYTLIEQPTAYYDNEKFCREFEAADKEQ